MPAPVLIRRARSCARLRGYALTVALVVACDWSSKALAARTLSDTIVNPASPSLPLAALMLLAGAAACVLVGRPGAVAGAGMLAGGFLANAADRALFGPVLDFIPEPLRDGWYANLADVSLLAGALSLSVSYLLYARAAWRPAALALPA